MKTWKIVQTKPCDGVGCCDTHGLFPGKGHNEGRCRYWTGSRCALMLDPLGGELQVALSAAERRAFWEFCYLWPVPGRVPTLDRTYTEKEKELLNFKTGTKCCYQWEEVPSAA